MASAGTSNSVDTGDGKSDIASSADVKQWIARQEHLVQQLGDTLLEKMAALGSKQDATIKILSAQRQSYESPRILPMTSVMSLSPWVEPEAPEAPEAPKAPAADLPTKEEKSHDKASADLPIISKEDWLTRQSQRASIANGRASTASEGAKDKMTHFLKPFERLGGHHHAQPQGVEVAMPDEPLTTWSERVVKNLFFEPLCAFLLVTNAIFIGVQVEKKSQQSTRALPAIYTVIDVSYTLWFIVEVMLRGSAVGVRKFFTDPDHQNWNLFDTLVVIVSVLDEIISLLMEDTSGVLSNLTAIRALRVFRVLRVLRIIRVMHIFRSFRILVSCLFSTAKSCVWASLLLFVVLYMFAIVFAQGVSDHRLSIAPKKLSNELHYYYGSLPRGIFTLFKSIIGGIDWEIAVQALSDVSWLYVMLFVFMLAFTYLSVMNVLSGIFLQHALEQVTFDRDDVIEAQLRSKESYVQQVVEFFREVDSDRTDGISRQELEDHLKDERMVLFLQALEIEMYDAFSLLKLLDADGDGTISISEFVEGCLRMKGNAKSAHIAQIMYENKWIMQAIVDQRKAMDQRFSQVEALMAKAPRSWQSSQTPRSDVEGGSTDRQSNRVGPRQNTDESGNFVLEMEPSVVISETVVVPSSRPQPFSVEAV